MTNATMVGTAYPFAHRPHVSDTFVTLTDSGRFNERVTTTTYKTTGNADGSYVVVVPVETLRQEFEGVFELSRDLIRNIDTTIQYDYFGNPTTTSQKTGDGFADSSVNSYQYNLPAWLVSMQTGSVETGTAPTGATTKRTRHFVPDPNTGILSAQTIEPNGSEDTYQQTTFQVDSHGIPTGVAVIDKSGRHARHVRLGFDSEDLYPSFTANALGRVERFAFHRAFGSTALHEDTNQVADKRQYDGFGRLRSIIPGDGASVGVKYPSSLFPETDVIRADGYTFSTFSDAYMNAVERDWTGFDGKTTILLTSYNSQGLVTEQNGPCLYSAAVCSASGSEQYTYDEMGRLIGVIHTDGSSRKTTHYNLTTTHFDELQNQRYTLQDQLGRVTKSVAISDSGAEIPVMNIYAPFGLVENIVDPKGNTIHTTYDVRGWPKTLQHPDSGNHSFSWNTFSELREEQDGNGLLTTYERDPLGRVRRIRNKDGIAEFCWDTSAHGVGMLAKSRSSDDVATEYTYDALGRPAVISSIIRGKTRDIGMSYDSIGRIASIAYPSVQGRPRFEISEHYNKNGYLKQIVDANSGKFYWQANKENERGQITDELIGGGLEIQRGFDTRGFLRSISTSANGAAVQQLGYTYFATGSVQSRSTQLQQSTITETFKYDALDRLKGWIAASAPNTAPNNSSELLDQSFSYDDLGNLQQRTINFGPGHTQVYQYGQNHAGPHAATQLNFDAYKYDSAGNQISGPDRNIKYTSFNLPTKLRSGANHVAFKYDAMHQRSLKWDSNGDTTIYLGGLYEERRHQGQLTNVFYVPGAGRLIAQVEQSAGKGGAIRYLYNDHLASVQLFTENKAPIVGARVSYEPLGRESNPANPAIPSSSGLGSVTESFTEHSLDAELKLLDMVGRIYDPNLGRFLTPDPIVQNPLRSESLNPYSYAWNNPLKWVDSSGFQDESGENEPGTPLWAQTTYVFEPTVITGQPSNADNTVPSGSADDNGTLSPPPLVNAPDNPGPDLSGGAKSLPSEWEPYPYTQASTDGGVRTMADFLALPTEAQFQQLKEAGIPVQFINGHSLAPAMTDAEKLALDLQNEEAMALAAYGGTVAAVTAGLQRPLQSLAEAAPTSAAVIEMVVGPYGNVSRTALETAATSGGETLTVVTRLTATPQPGRALSVATGEGAQSLANAARAGGQIYSAQIPVALMRGLERVGLAQQSITRMGGLTGTEINFLPAATEFIVPFFK